MTRINNSGQIVRESPRQADCIRPKGSVGRAPADRRVIRLLAAIAFATASLAPSARGANDATPVAPKRSSSSFDFSYVVRVASVRSAHNVNVWIPLPSTDEFQTISEVQLEAPVRVQVRKEKDGNEYAHFTLHSSRTPSPFEIRVTFHVVRYERRIDLASGIDPPGPFPKDVAAFLQPNELAPIYEAIAALSREQTQGLASPLEKARRLYEYVTSTMRDDHAGTGACREDALRGCHLNGGDCTDFDSTFVALARAAGIPARLEIGFLLPEGQKEGIVPGYHCWAEFYVNGLGWIPVDASQASQDANKRNLYFGGIDSNRVMISTGRGPGAMRAPEAGPSNHIAHPYIQMDGTPSPNYSIDFFFDEAKFTSGTPSLTHRPICADGRSLTSGRLQRFPA